MRRVMTNLIGAVVVFACNFLQAQPAEIRYRTEPYEFNSGLHKGQPSAEQARLAITSRIQSKRAAWIRVFFGEVKLSIGSYLLITSHADGAQQRLDASTIVQWKNTSAFFNGDAVDIELHVAPRDSGAFFTVDELMVGEYNSTYGIESICGSDDRTHLDDPAVGRIVPSGCTGWIASSGVFVTAGHCAISTSEVLEFNVPLSLSDGTRQHPEPKDQYIIDQASWVSNTGAFGDDWAVFSVFNNSTTELHPLVAQNASYQVAQNLSASPLRVTGFGTDSGSDNFTSQTHSGPNAGSSGTTLRYQVDTDNGNSGSPVIDVNTGKAIGVHTDEGCTSSGGSNIGTSTFNSEFWDALNPPPIDVTLDQKLADNSTPVGTIGR